MVYEWKQVRQDAREQQPNNAREGNQEKWSWLKASSSKPLPAEDDVIGQHFQFGPQLREV